MANNFIGNYSYNDIGVIIPETSEILETVQQEYKGALGEDLSLEESTPQGRLIDTETQARQSTIRFNAAMANSMINIRLCSGPALDAWGTNFDVPRNGATSSTVTVLVTGVADTVIPAGSQALDVNGIIWNAQSEIIIGQNGSATGTFECSQTGEISLGVNELTVIVTGSTSGVNGWETITNTSVATLGSEKESDAAYFLRIIASIFSGTALFGNYSTAAYSVPGVNDVYLQENPYGTPLILDGITIPAHSVFVCVDGGNSYDVAYALYEVKSAGCGWTGNTTVIVTDKVFNTLNTVMYESPQAAAFKFNIKATSLNNSNADLETTIQNIIIDYFSGVYSNIGYPKQIIRANISPFTVASLLNSQLNGVNINSVEVGLVSPEKHAIPSIIKKSITSGITWASVNTQSFGEQVNEDGVYNFIFDGTNWQLNSSDIDLTTYGITVSGSPITGDIVSILYSTGELSQNPIKLFVNEKATVSAENITVTING